MKKAKSWIMIVLLSAVSGFFAGCVTDTASLKVEKTLPQEKLAYYNDTFDKLRTDLWEKAGYTYNEAQKSNFKLGKMRVQDGKLWVQTETGCFSKGGLGSKYGLKGDFDIQVDCQINFLDGEHNMDQILTFLVIERGKAIMTGDVVFLRLSREGVNASGELVSAARTNGRYHPGNSRDIENFDGTLRIVRKGSQISTLYKTKGDKEWKLLNSFRSTSNDLEFGLLLQNFSYKRTIITANAPITARFDNFRINAAEEIIEGDI
ncbi:MAG: hypothetical protein U5R49_13160 [Deltaproteobacteria bacterium]|nr:hypothetical protein [Deltaproteobacteria bacterium]